ncbi:MAG TPA: DoxX family protein [Phycisphaerae bacterium]
MTRPVSTARYLDATGVPLLIARLVLAGMFLYTGVQKIREPGDFRRALRQYETFADAPAYVINLTTAVLPWIEVVCGVALLVGLAIRGAALTLLLLLMVFTALVLERALGEYNGTKPFCEIAFNCGCGTGVEKICAKLIENIALIVLALVAMGSHSRRYCASRLFWPQPYKDLQSCTACAYPLHGLMGRTCPDCGAPREPYVRKALGRA